MGQAKHERNIEHARAARAMREKRRRTDRDPWSRDDFFRDLGRASELLTQEIEEDDRQAAALDRSRQQAREGRLHSQDEFDRKFPDDE